MKDSLRSRDRARPSRWSVLLCAQRAWIAAILFGVGCGGGPLNAQNLQPRIPSSTLPSPCAAANPSGGGTPEVGRALEILRLGQQAAVTGDRTSAREFLAEAARLDPTSPDAAYHHARILEDLGERDAARLEYCRFLTLPVSAPDSAEVADRIAALLPARGSQAEEARLAMSRGAEFLAADDPRSAERAFSYVVHHHPGIPEAYLNRAIAREARGQRAGAIRDLREYLLLSPHAADRQVVEARIEQLAASVPTPETAGTRGLMIPGLGQFTTQRPALGAVTLAAVAGSVALATAHSRIETRTEIFEHPFGREEPYTYEYQERVRPYLVAGIAAGAAITIGAAVEAYLHARSIHAAAGDPESLRAGRRSVRPFLTESVRRDAIGLGLRLPAGR